MVISSASSRHVLAEEGHPGRCRPLAPGGRRWAAGRCWSKTPDVVRRPRKPPSTTFLTLSGLAVHPPGKVQQELIMSLKKIQVRLAAECLLGAVQKEGSECVDRWFTSLKFHS